jgi:hypothetical protein
LQFKPIHLVLVEIIDILLVQIFQTLGFYYNDKLYEENTFSEMELFNKSLSEHLNTSEIEVNILKTVLHGICFTLAFTTEIDLNNASSIVMNRPWDIVIYFHNEEEQFWLLWDTVPILMTSLKFNINSRYVYCRYIQLGNCCHYFKNWNLIFCYLTGINYNFKKYKHQFVPYIFIFCYKDFISFQ